jgi:hypothetical protein
MFVAPPNPQNHCRDPITCTQPATQSPGSATGSITLHLPSCKVSLACSLLCCSLVMSRTCRPHGCDWDACVVWPASHDISQLPRSKPAASYRVWLPAPCSTTAKQMHTYMIALSFLALYTTSRKTTSLPLMHHAGRHAPHHQTVPSPPSVRASCMHAQSVQRTGDYALAAASSTTTIAHTVTTSIRGTQPSSCSGPTPRALRKAVLALHSCQ